MTGRATWDSPWPAEDGGATRQQAPDGGSALGLSGAGVLTVTRRDASFATMAVLRDPGEVFLLRCGFGNDGAGAWVERIHPETLEPVRSSEELAGGPWWPGGMVAHANGSLHVTFGQWCHRLDADCAVVASRRLPRARPYNSLVVLPGGELVMKDFGIDLAEPAGIVVLDPDTLEPLGPEVVVPEPSIARLSARENDVYVVGTHSMFRFRWDPERGHLERDESWSPKYRHLDGQGYGWDAVIDADSAWFLDNGEGTTGFQGSFRGRGIATAPLHLVRVPLGAGEPDLVEICGLPGGIVANPPAIDAERQIAVGFDSGNGVLAGFRFGAHGEAMEQIWRREQDHGGHMLRWPATGDLLTYDFDHDAGTDEMVVLDIETGVERARAATGSAMQSVVFPAVGWGRDAYYCSFDTVARVAAAG